MENKPKKRVTIPEIIDLPYTEWKESLKRCEILPCEQIWLQQWEQFDLAVSPIDDDERRFMRYGHYLGWFEHRRRVGGNDFNA